MISACFRSSLEFPDYPYAKFNVKPDTITYSVQEYNIVTNNDSNDSRWNKEETDQLVSLIDSYGLRWNIISDRFVSATTRSVEDLKERYYNIASMVLRLRKQQGLILSPYETKLTQFNYNSDYDKKRKRQLEAQLAGVSKTDDEVCSTIS